MAAPEQIRGTSLQDRRIISGLWMRTVADSSSLSMRKPQNRKTKVKNKVRLLPGMSQTYEKTFSISQASPKPAFSYSSETSIIKVVLSQSTTQQPGPITDKVVSLGIAENESIDDANNDMDLLAQQSFEDL